MTIPRLMPLALVFVVFLTLACSGPDAEPSPQPTALPEPTQASQSVAGETSGTTPAESVETTRSATPNQQQTEPVSESDPAPVTSESTSTTSATSATSTASPGATEPAAPAQKPAGEVAVKEPAPAASGPAQCQLVQGEAGQPGEVQLDVEVIAEGLAIPWGLAILPTGDLLVTERPGRLRLIQGGEIVPEPVLEFGVSMPPPLYGIDLLGSEGGLLGVLLHPEFTTNRLFYLFYNIDNEDDVQIGRIERYALSDDGRSATFDQVILDDLPAGLHHQGGRMRLGPDGMLYVGVGAYDPTDAQNPDTLAGKLLRMDLEGGIPADNPDPDSYIFASGIRNTQGYDWFDERHIVMIEHGPSGIELGMPDLRGYDEVNVVTAGDNLGWPHIWGCDTQEGLVSPVLTWDEPVPPTGGIFYRGDLIPEWTGSFLFTTVGLRDRPVGRHLHRVVFDQDDPYTVLAHEVYLHHAYGRLRTVVSDADGRLYVMTSNCDNRGECPPEGDLILRIGPAR